MLPLKTIRVKRLMHVKSMHVNVNAPNRENSPSDWSGEPLENHFKTGQFNTWKASKGESSSPVFLSAHLLQLLLYHHRQCILSND
ncbi:hypothetical protein TNCV_466471 [Trichonephila clavipes]|uniref:Uncharacterized protein n=1 Tax=Trichonephila clavipes TaxID=2585209 RepID=A0A8X6UXG8_TRICX|nr:hypothetical protein TNCV_855851 [Trichonephila clavipes]GFX87213.1 hypothetical protein TNCV_466471 [Trichonephila clavipes]